MFGETLAVPINTTNRGLIGSLGALAASGAEILRDGDKTFRDVLFRNVPCLVAYKTFIAVLPGDEKNSINLIARLEAWLNCFIENLHLRLKGVRC